MALILNSRDYIGYTRLPNDITRLIKGKKLAHDYASVASGAMSAAATVTVPGAAVTNVALATSSVALPAGTFLEARVTAANTVSVYLVNLSGGAVDLAATNLEVSVLTDIKKD